MIKLDFSQACLLNDELPVFLYDFTGCLSDDETPIRDNIETLARRMGFIIDRDNRQGIWADWFGRGNQYIYDFLSERALYPQNLPSFGLFQQEFERRYEEDIQNGKLFLREGQADALMGMASVGWPRAIVTNDEPGLLAMKLDRFAFREGTDVYDPTVFQAITGLTELSDAGLPKKPAPDAYVLTAETFIRANTTGKRLVFVALEDSTTGLRAASAAMTIINEKYSHCARFAGCIHTPYTPADPVSDLPGIVRMMPDEKPWNVVQKMLGFASRDMANTLKPAV